MGIVALVKLESDDDDDMVMINFVNGVVLIMET